MAPSAPVADVWDAAEQAAAPDDRSAYQVQKPQARSPDFLDFAALIETAKAPVRPAEAQTPTDAWLTTPAPAPPPAEIPVQVVPSPRRPAPPPPPHEETPTAAVVPAAGAQPQPVSDAALLARIARAAGIPERAIAGRDPNALADEIGLAIRLSAQNLAQMLSTRAESKTLMRSASRTMVRAIENNPLKFTSSVEEALAIMFGGPTRQYLDARATIEASFADLKTHQLLTYGAMRDALEALFEDLAPERIDRSVEADHGLGRIVASRKAKLWDIYVDRWRAKTKRADGRLLEAFMALFAEAYDRLQNKGR